VRLREDYWWVQGLAYAWPVGSTAVANDAGIGYRFGLTTPPSTQLVPGHGLQNVTIDHG
jgi:hypothetical protein